MITIQLTCTLCGEKIDGIGHYRTVTGMKLHGRIRHTIHIKVCDDCYDFIHRRSWDRIAREHTEKGRQARETQQ